MRCSHPFSLDQLPTSPQSGGGRLLSSHSPIYEYHLYALFSDMEPLSVTASIIAVLQLSAKTLGYLINVKNAPKDRTQCATEVSNLFGLLLKLKDQVEQGDPMQPWYTEAHALAVKNGPLDQVKQALETLQTKMTDGGRLRKVREALKWKFEKEEIASILNQIERLKSLVEIVLQMGHL
jgi:phosphohistidine phosphatase SixA